jgi:hypothetical protein
VHGQLQPHLLVGPDLVEVQVEDVGPHRVPLDLADQGADGLSADGELDDSARPFDALQRLAQGEGVEGE